MRSSLRVVLFVAMGCVAPYAGRAQSAVVSPPEIVSSASAERPVQANLATVTLRFSRDARTAVGAVRSVALTADSLRRSLAALGIPRDSIVNGNRWYWWPQRIQKIESSREVTVADTGRDGHVQRYQRAVPDSFYRAQETLNLRIRDLSKVGAVIDVAVAAGVLDISEISFQATDTEAVQREAIREATERARARAQLIAVAGGGRLGRTMRLSTDGDGETSRQYYLSGIVALGSAEPRGETVVVAPVLTVKATVSGRWEFVEPR